MMAMAHASAARLAMAGRARVVRGASFIARHFAESEWHGSQISEMTAGACAVFWASASGMARRCGVVGS